MVNTEEFLKKFDFSFYLCIIHLDKKNKLLSRVVEGRTLRNPATCNVKDIMLVPNSAELQFREMRKNDYLFGFEEVFLF